MADQKRTALVLIDWINDIVHPDGKLAGHGYPAFMQRHSTPARVAETSGYARSNGWLIVHVKVAFSWDYRDHPAASPLMGPARLHGALRDGDWGTQFHAEFQPIMGETVITKRRVNAFHGTDLDLLLRANKIGRIVIAGVATDLSVQSTARDGHDRDYEVLVIGDACAAENDNEHVASLSALRKVARVIDTGVLTASFS